MQTALYKAFYILYVYNEFLKCSYLATGQGFQIKFCNKQDLSSTQSKHSSVHMYLCPSSSKRKGKKLKEEEILFKI